MSENLTGVVMGYKDWHKSVIATLQGYDEKKGEAGAQVRADRGGIAPQARASTSSGAIHIETSISPLSTRRGKKTCSRE